MDKHVMNPYNGTLLSQKRIIYAQCVCVCVCVCSVASVVSDIFVTLWTIACQAPLFMGFQPRNQTCGSCIAGGFFTTESPGKSMLNMEEQKTLYYMKEASHKRTHII